MRAKPKFQLLLLILALAIPQSAMAQDAVAPGGEPVVIEEKPAPYDERLMRLAEILGSVHYLRNLCKGEEKDWRDSMQRLIDIEAGKEPMRKGRLTAAFNRGYRSFASVYTQCTAQAIASEEKYRAEGATLATEIIARYGN